MTREEHIILEHRLDFPSFDRYMPRQLDTPKLHFSTVHFLASVFFFSVSGRFTSIPRIKVLAQCDIACVGRTSNVRTRGRFFAVVLQGQLDAGTVFFCLPTYKDAL